MRPESQPTKRNLAAALGNWSARHRAQAILGWLAFVVLAFAIGNAVGQKHLTNAQMSNGQTATAMNIWSKAFPQQAGEQVLIQVRGSLQASDPAFRATVRDLTARLEQVPYVTGVRSPLTRNAGLISKDRRSALVTFNLAGNESQVQKRVDAALKATAATQSAHPQFRVEEFGDASANRAVNQSFAKDFQKAEYTSLPVTLAILLFAFGALVAAGIPLLLGMTAVIAALGLLGPFSQLIPVAEGTIDSIVLLIGLAVGVDYSMFYLRRKMEERRAGLDSDSALRRAAATSGRAVLISGLTVIMAMAGMFLAGNSVFTSFALGTVLVVAMAVVGSVTVLPAVMSKLGDRVEKGRAPFIARRRAQGDSRAWAWIIDHVLRSPRVSFAAATALLVALALPALTMHTVSPGTISLPRTLPIMHTYDRIQAAFPGGPIPAVVVVKAGSVTSSAVQQGIGRMESQALASGQMRGPFVVSVSPDQSVATINVSLPGNGTDRRSEAALSMLRSSVIPATIGQVPGASAYVMGMTAGSADFNATMKSHLPLVFAFVLGLAFVLLLVTFRSVVIPLTAIFLNLLSVGAAYGALKLVFQDGFLRSQIGATDIGGVVDWLPLFLFVVLFGLSMDYHVLILSRIREEHERGVPTADAVGRGLKSTAGVVTSAAIVMVAVFSIFATLSEVVFKQVGLGLAVAVLIDATIVRAVLLPSAMKLLGERNWYMPKGVRLPAWSAHRRTTPRLHL